MIEEYAREMSATERASLQSAMRPQPAGAWHSDSSRETWGLAAVWILTLVVIALTGGANKGGLAAAGAAGALVIGYRLVTVAIGNARRRKLREGHTAHTFRELSRVLQDGRVAVKRVRAAAVVEIEALEDEGTGYVFDVEDGRVLFIKGQDYFPSDDEMPWPNTEFEIVRAAADGRLLDVHCHGAPLAPLRVVPRDDVDPERGWDEREEVLEMSVDDAVRTILHDR